MNTRTCTECSQALPITEFYKHPQMGDGYLNQCKGCKRAYQRDRHHRKMLDPEWRAKERARSRKKMKGKAQKRDKVKRSAHTAVSNAVRDGRLTAPDQCEQCGHDFSHFRREAHHNDYDKPLEVEWLCSICHGKRHRKR